MPICVLNAPRLASNVAATVLSGMLGGWDVAWQIEVV